VKVTGVGGRRVGARARISGGRLVISLAGAPTQVTVSTGYPTLRQGAAHLAGLTLKLLATDAGGHGTTVRVGLRAR
jgi:hypothetical protein